MIEKQAKKREEDYRAKTSNHAYGSYFAFKKIKNRKSEGKGRGCMEDADI